MSESVYIHGTHHEEQARLAKLNRLTNAAFLAFLELKPDDCVLEVGSGLGILANEVAQRTPRGEVIGVEFSPDQLAAAIAPSSNLRFQQGDAHALPFEPDRFDVVYSRFLLEHVADPLKVLREMHRVLKPHGKAFAQENNILVNVFYPDCPRFERVWRQFAVLQEKLGGDALIGKKLFALFKQAGFQDIRMDIAPEIHWAGQPTFRPWIENQIHNVVGAADKLIDHQLTGRQEIEEALCELKDFCNRDDACAFFYWNRAKGIKT